MFAKQASKIGSSIPVASSLLPGGNLEPNEGEDFGLGFGARGRKTNIDKKGPASGLPQPGKKSWPNSLTNTELEISRSNRSAIDWKATSKIPGDSEPSVARSDYYEGDKGDNQFNTVNAESEIPSVIDDHYEHSIDAWPHSGYRDEQGSQPYVKWDFATRNMRKDNITQRDDDGKA